MLVIGLTGGIASGKSTVADRFANTHHVPIIDTDRIARQLVTPDQPAFATIVQHFGNTILTAQGELDRSKLRELIFTQPDQKKWLEQLLHPLIRQVVETSLQTLRQQTPPPLYCIIVIPLLVETQAYAWLDDILVIDTDEKNQQQRLHKRDNLTLDQCQKILTNQASRQQRLAIANRVIANNSTLAALAQTVDQQHQHYLAMAKSNQ